MLCAARIEREPFSPPVVEQMFTDASLKRVPAGGSRDHVDSVGFIDPLPTRVDPAIGEAQRCIVEALDLDGSTLFEPSDGGDFLATQRWWRPEIPVPPAPASLRESFPRMLPKLMAGELVSSRAPTDCRTASTARACFASGCKSTVVVPLSVGQRIVGLVSFDMTRGERDWHLETFSACGSRRACSPACSPGGKATRRCRRALGEVKSLTEQLVGERVPAPRSREHARPLHCRPERRDSPRARAGAAGSRDRCDGPPFRRDGLRQRGVRVADS